VILYFSVRAPYRWVIVDRRNRVLEDGIAESLDHIPMRHRRITRRVGVVPGELVTIRSLRIPARSRAKAVAAVPYMLEETVASSLEDLDFRLILWGRGGESKVAVTSREAIESWRRELEGFPGHADALVPEYLLLPRHTEGRCTIAADGEGRLIIRTGNLDGLVIDEQDLDLWWEEIADRGIPIAVNSAEHARRLVERGGLMVSEWRIGRHFTDWVRHGHQVPQNVDLLPHGGDSANALVSRTSMKVAAVLLGLALVVRLGLDGYDYVTLTRRDRQLDSEIASTLTGTFPDITRVVKPKVQMEQRIAALRGQVGGSGFLALLSVVAQAVPAVRASVEEISFQSSTLLVTCRTSDFAALDKLRQRFVADGRVNVDLVSSGSLQNSVSGRFRLGLKVSG
jgi:general secretion pathway protein L